MIFDAKSHVKSNVILALASRNKLKMVLTHFHEYAKRKKKCILSIPREIIHSKI
jgi:hypothetical protein